ncbi:MAG TPA: PhzF family phenazine biosynthesis protein [Pseudomonas xinjiangensis]|uniref:PhzF family phenazine biosynthesis protein n=2 Tax=root TaxID=1 RepID=A0A7V1BQK4_9GAMM|nr:PhzF family phenazine biosynthesis protein [Halopseudomonas xinjiangensis]HEC48363.1 PhzF family phenazine biosynthesis protein [Halopseudomonas xinjiangensis]
MFQIDAFTDRLFGGNSAAVVPLQTWLPDALMQSIAVENNLSETAFFVRQPDGTYAIRWFSPLSEIAFCGHATLASAFVLFRQDSAVKKVTFTAPAVGSIDVAQRADGRITMRFPLRAPEPAERIPPALLKGLSIAPSEVLVSDQAWFALYENEQSVREVVPVPELLATLGPLDVVVTAPGLDHDFVSRYFWPANGGLEDPVTGSIHAGLAPLWAVRLGKSDLVAQQASARSGIVYCQVMPKHVLVSGDAVLFLQGIIQLPD